MIFKSRLAGMISGAARSSATAEDRQPTPAGSGAAGPPVIDLASAPGHQEAWDRPAGVVYLWALTELALLRNPLQPSSRIRAGALRWFGAEIGRGVILRPGLRVKFPWKLTVGDHSWIGEDVWLHNQDQLRVGADVVLSQQTFVTTGTHAFRTDMALTTRPVDIEDGAWVTARCTVLGGARIGRSAVVLPATVVRGTVPDNALYGPPPAGVVGERFRDRPERAD